MSANNHVPSSRGHHGQLRTLGLYSLSGKTSYRQISWSLEATRLSVAAEVPVKFQSNWKSLNLNLVTSRLHEILRLDVLRLSE